MDRAGLTDAYLDAVKQGGARASDLVAGLGEPEVLLNSFVRDAGYLSRPLFVTRDEIGRLHSDAETVRRALVSLPERLYSGDLVAFARDAGAEGYQIEAIARSVSNPVSAQARADLYEDSRGFRLMEFNMGSALGGMENADLCRVMLRHPLLAEFARAHGLRYVDTMREQVNNLAACTGRVPESHPVVAVTDWPSSYHSHLGPYMGKLAIRWREFGLDAHACHLGELQVRDGRVWLRGRAVDVIARMFLLEHLLEPGAKELMDPILGAAERGEVAMFTPLDTELFGSKAALAMLSDLSNRHLFSDDELAAIDRLLPWTRRVAPGPLTLEDGASAELFEYAISHADDLVLKPALRYGGQDVLPGWHPGTSPQRWRDALAKAMGGPYVIQRRIHPVAELFPGEDPEFVPWIVAWGVYTGARGYGGLITRGVTVESGVAVLNAAVGARLGCCLVADAVGG